MGLKENCLATLEVAFWNWRRATGTPMPEIGIIVIGLSYSGCDLQYIGKEPNVVMDWPALFQNIAMKFAAGEYDIHPEAGISFPGQR